MQAQAFEPLTLLRWPKNLAGPRWNQMKYPELPALLPITHSAGFHPTDGPSRATALMGTCPRPLKGHLRGPE